MLGGTVKQSKFSKTGSNLENIYLRILKEELVPAMGCTEPIALAYAAAKAKEVLGEIPDKIEVEVSGNIIKNVKSVVVPNTNGLKGIEAAISAGIIAGKANRELEVLSNVSSIDKARISEYLCSHEIKVMPAASDLNFDIIIKLYKDGLNAKLRIIDDHTNIVLIEKNGKVIYKEGKFNSHLEHTDSKKLLNVCDIYNFVNTVDFSSLENTIGRQITYNMNISEEGLKNNYGSSIGNVILSMYGNDVKTRAKAMAAAGSDARMSGCELPVIIVSGSGNQGITASVPIIEFAKEYCIDKERLYRAVALSDLIAIHLKAGIGSLSAFCGAVCAGCGSGAGIAYLLGADLDAISHTIVNAVAIVSGMVCDGAKPSCAAKIASSVEAGILGYNMYLNNKNFLSGDGIVGSDIETTIRNVWRLGKYGMKQTDTEILKIMTGN